MPETCDVAFTLPQVDATCWFNSLLSVLFYSDGMVGLIKSILPTLIKKTKSKKKLEIYNVLEQLAGARDIKNFRDFSKFYTTLNPTNILKFLHSKKGIHH